MKKDSKGSPKWVSVLNNLIYCIIALCFVLMSCQKQPSDNNRPNPKPPDLSKCTRLEVICSMPIMKLLRPLKDLGSDFFNDEQMEYLQTTKKFIIEDKNDIRLIARAVSSGTFKEGGAKEVNLNPRFYAENMSVVGYRNHKQIVKINMYKSYFILNEDNQRFNYRDSLPNLLLFLPENIKTSILRAFCAIKLDVFWEEFLSMVSSKKTYPIPEIWCDIAKERIENDELRLRIEKDGFRVAPVREFFICPSAGEGKCHYAMNPNCQPNSPGDMVLLFETKAGWNQHGGPEIFTFDNHDPKGGCVILNDGTIKFIRTKEELNALRWK